MKKPVIILTIVAFALLSLSYLKPTETWYNTNEFLQELWVKLKVYSKETNPERIYISTDKPLYVPGETVWFTAFIRNADDLKASRKSGIAYAEVYTPKGSLHKKVKLIAHQGITSGDFALHESMPGGIYKIKVYTNWLLNSGDSAIAEKEIQVQKSIMPRLLMKLDFPEKGYGAGAEVTAELELNTMDNLQLKHHRFSYLVQLNGITYLSSKAVTDHTGKANITFTLPEKLTSADGLLNVIIPYKNNSESISRAIPIIYNQVKMAFYPEGGEMVDGLPCNIAFEALDMKKKPVKLKGAVLNSKGKEVAYFNTFHHGRGSFEIIPQAGEVYKVRVDEPKITDTTYSLPKALPYGLTLQLGKFSKEALQAEIWTKEPTVVSLLLSMRGKPIYAEEKSLQKGRNYFTIPIDETGEGVAALTIFSNDGEPLAERMIFLNRHKQMQVNITTDKKKYGPREKVKMEVQALDEKGNPVAANLSLSVVDDKVHTLADDKTGHLLSKLLLEADIKGEIEEPNFYFDEEKPNSLKALDYVMLTRGWRKFEWKKVHSLQAPPPTRKPQLAVVTGQLISADPKTEIKNARIIVKATGREYFADSRGNFQLSNLDLYEPQELLVKAGKQEFHFIISDYLQDISIALAGGRAYVFNAGQTNGILAGVIYDDNGNPLQGAAIGTYQNGFRKSVASDKNGYYELRLPPGQHDVFFHNAGFFNYTLPVEITEKQVILHSKMFEKAEEIHFRDAEVVSYRKKLIEPDNNTAAYVVTREEIRHMPARSVNSISPVNDAFNSPSRVPNVRGNRSNNTRYYVDGVQVRDKNTPTTNAPKAANKVVVPVVAEEELVPVKIEEVEVKLTGEREFFEKGKAANRNSGTIVVEGYYKARVFPEPEFLVAPEKVHKDYSTTIYWNGNLTTGKDGKASVEFFSTDNLSAFKATAEGISAEGLAGRADYKFYTTEPLRIEAKIPPVLTRGDKISIPVSIDNNTETDFQGTVDIRLPVGLKLIKAVGRNRLFAANSTHILVLECEATTPGTEGLLSISAVSPNYQSILEKPVKVVSGGFPVQLSFSGQSADQVYEFDIQDPGNADITADFIAYPNILRELMGGVKGILREPYGCFEQASSATYPNILALQYMRETGQQDEATEKAALAMIEKGYKLLTRYETAEKGYEWFGQSPPNEALTAYGLMEFVDMQKVYGGVSADMVKRTRNWIMGRRDGKGGFNNGSKALDKFGRAGEEITNAYIVYALTEAGERNLAKEFETAVIKALESNDPYQLALVANAAYNLKRPQQAGEICQLLVKSQNTDGSWNAKTTSITNSSGTGLTVETTALAMLALSKEPGSYHRQITEAAKFITAQRQGSGTFGSTQATILALKALTKFAKQPKLSPRIGTVQVYVNETLAGTISYTENDTSELKFGLAKYFEKGKNTVRVKYLQEEAALPYTVHVKWHTALPVAGKQQPVKVQTALSANTIKAGENLRLQVNIENTMNTVANNPIAIIGIPAGTSLQPWQLRDLQKQKAFDYYEFRDNDIVFYYRQIEPRGKRQILLDLKTEVPGTYNAVASSGYLYYTNEFKSWSGLGELTILP